VKDTSAIRTIHQLHCRSLKANGRVGSCNCRRTYMPEPWDRLAGRKVRGRVCATLAEARNERNTMRGLLMVRPLLSLEK